MKFKKEFALLLLSIFISACGLSTDELVMTNVASTEYTKLLIEHGVQQSVDITSTYVASLPTTTPTITSTPPVIASHTPTPTPVPVVVILHDGYAVRNGPGTVYRTAQYVMIGDMFTAIGVDSTGLWIAIDTNLENHVWVKIEDVQINFSIESLAILESPATPGHIGAKITAEHGWNHITDIIFLVLRNLESGFEYNFYLEPGKTVHNYVPYGNYKVTVGIVDEKSCYLDDFEIFEDIRWAPYIPNICDKFP